MTNRTTVGSLLPRRGHAIVTLAALDENGYTHHYAPVEVRRDVLAETLATLTRPASTAREERGRSPLAETR